MKVVFETVNPPLTERDHHKYFIVYKEGWSAPRVCAYRHEKTDWARFVEQVSGNRVFAHATGLRYEPITWEQK